MCMLGILITGEKESWGLKDVLLQTNAKNSNVPLFVMGYLIPTFNFQGSINNYICKKVLLVVFLIASNFIFLNLFYFFIFTKYSAGNFFTKRIYFCIFTIKSFTLSSCFEPSLGLNSFSIAWGLTGATSPSQRGPGNNRYVKRMSHDPQNLLIRDMSARKKF